LPPKVDQFIHLRGEPSFSAAQYGVLEDLADEYESEERCHGVDAEEDAGENKPPPPSAGFVEFGTVKR
jgi:hypothetical protein